MPLLKINDYLDEYFGKKSRPPIKTVYKWIREGKLPAQKMGRCYYIDTDRLTVSTGNPLADKIINNDTTR